MFSIIRRRPVSQRAILTTSLVRREFLSNVQVPFQDDLTSTDFDDFNLGDFQHYQESPDVIAKRYEMMNETIPEPEKSDKKRITSQPYISTDTSISNLQDLVQLKEPLVFQSKLTSPYLNLAIESYIYDNMPKPETDDINYNRLMFYVNSPCVVIGKNQNPWKEVNLPLLTNLMIPLVRRKSGGGTVVHDLGNINYSFMTTKEKFDRFQFAHLVRDAVNSSGFGKYQLEVNDRGDITTTKQEDGVNYKISGSAYKLSRGKSYHHGTMLLNSRLDVLGKLLHRDENKLGKVDASNVINSVKSKVSNLEMESDKFVEVVSSGFQNVYGTVEQRNVEQAESEEEFDQNELFGLSDFVSANSTKNVKKFTIDEMTELPSAIVEVAEELKTWAWRFGSTPKFTHELHNNKLGFKVKFIVGKNAKVEGFELSFMNFTERPISEAKIRDSFEYLETFIKDNNLEYTGSNVAGFITNDIISDWVGESIDGTV
ncbi:hypothetical protein G9P44_003858 [Scheffersomyces stipitis]|nr:hypothetical protein G9P44_003858 [Scheffersomyces stipitis]